MDENKKKKEERIRQNWSQKGDIRYMENGQIKGKSAVRKKYLNILEKVSLEGKNVSSEGLGKYGFGPIYTVNPWKWKWTTIKTNKQTSKVVRSFDHSSS